MEVLTKLKFWKSNFSKVAAGTTTDCAETVTDSIISDHLTEYSDNDDDDDSFFELELSLPSNDCKLSKKSDAIESDDLKFRSKPQSPISILRAASPKLRVFMFGRFSKKSKRVVEEEVEEEFFETESVSSSSPKKSSSNLFTVKFKIEDGSIVPKFTRNDCSFTNSPKISENGFETSKRFSKDVVQKYLGLMKPKSSKKVSDCNRFVAPAVSSPTRPSTTSFSSFPLAKKEKDDKQSSRFKVKCKQLGKCKSSSAMIGGQSPAMFPGRNDYPQDGIEGAILHCKRSLKGGQLSYSSLSRCSSDPSYEKSIQVSEVI